MYLLRILIYYWVKLNILKTQPHLVLIKNSFYYPFRPIFDRRPVERNRAVENGSKRSIKAVFGEQRIKLSF